MEKKNYIFAAIPLFAFSLLVYLYTTQNQQSKTDRSVAVVDDSPSPELEENTLGLQDSQERPTDDVDLETDTNDALYVDYKFDTGSSASYRIMKEFLNKPSQEVVGKGTSVKGYGSISKDGSTVKVNAQVDLKSVKTDSPKRDSDVLKLFKSTYAELEIDTVLQNPITKGVEVTYTVPAKLTLNEITKDVQFTVTANVTDSIVKANGTTKAKLTDFGIQPPSLVDVFSVSDDITFEFDIIGTRAN